MSEDTVAAIATPIGQAGIGVIRVSGDAALAVADRIFRPKPGRDRQAPTAMEERTPGTKRPSDFASHTVHFGVAVDPATGEPLDEVLLTVFRAPHSYTGEDTVELSCHGGPAILRKILNAALDAGAHPPEAGEFTKRAFLNGRLDLAQAEAVNDLIRAQTDEACRVALLQLEGSLSKKVREAASTLAGILARVEASIDFPDDVEEPLPEDTRASVSLLIEELNALLATADRGRVYREGARVAIAGRPNVGKSSLLNALLRQSRAIVTPIPGATRDTIEETVNLKGVPVVAIDTAGLRETPDEVESLGVRRAEETIERAHIVILALDAQAGLTEEDLTLHARMAGKRVLAVLNKADLLSEDEIGRVLDDAAKRLGASPTVVSALTGAGIEALEDRMAEMILGGPALTVESAMVTNVRHKRAIESALAGLSHALQTLDAGRPVDLLSVDLMAARNSLGEITGETATEDLIDDIFSEFCIGK